MNYYLIPIVDNYIYYNSKSLRDNLKEKNLLLYEKELKKSKILYNQNNIIVSQLMMEYNDYALEIKELYNTENIPQYIVAKGNLYSIREVVTGVKLEVSSEVNLKIREISKRKALKYLEENCSYSSKVNNFFDVVINNKKKVRKLK